MRNMMELASKILSDIVIHTKYAKYLPELSRRESWREIVTRNKNMHLKKYPQLKEEINWAYEFVYDKKVLPSLRSAQFAGKPIELNPARIYNCSFLPMDHPDAFAETMFLLLSGVGVGYSVQHHHVDRLPEIQRPKRKRRYLVSDSIEGWADAVKVLCSAYFYGKSIPEYDFRDIRPKGALLVTSGGKAPGPDPLRKCLEMIQLIFESKDAGEKLSSLEVHDINCLIADAVLSGGIRRSAMIALFDMDDQNMLYAKSSFPILKWEYVYDNGPINEAGETTQVQQIHKLNGSTFYDIRVTVDEPLYGESEKILTWVDSSDLEILQKTKTLPWYLFRPHRGRSNNTAVILRHKITKNVFKKFWKVVVENQTGEPGVFFTNDKDWGLNPCAEISLRPFQFCNLTTINDSDIVNQEDFNARARAAAIIGTMQAGYTEFHYLRDIWKRTTEKEALIGTSRTGIASGQALKLNAEEAAQHILTTNEEIAKKIGINKSARCTTVKPEGTASLVVGSSSGIHAWHNDYYVRRMRIGKNESIYKYLAKNHPELIEDEYFNPQQQSIVHVPQKAPDGAILRQESALDLLTRVSMVWNTWVKPGHRRGENYNNVSTTVSVKDDEWDIVGEWMWEHRTEFTALSVLPYDGHSYKQAPYEDITKKQYTELIKHLSDVDLTKVVEHEDNTELKESLACFAGACELQ